MARKETRTVWLSDAGVEYDTQKAAEAADARDEAIKALENGDVYWRDTSADEVVDFLIGNTAALKLVVKAAGLLATPEQKFV